MTNNTDKSILTTSSLFCKSGLLLIVLQFFSSSVCSAILLCFKLFCNSSLPLSVLQLCSASSCSAILLFFYLFCNSALLQAVLQFFSCFCLFLMCYSSLSFISHCAYCRSHTAHTVIFPFLQFNSFFIQNDRPLHSRLISSFIHTCLSN
jgi:hypothetical protein